MANACWMCTTGAIVLSSARALMIFWRELTTDLSGNNGFFIRVWTLPVPVGTSLHGLRTSVDEFSRWNNLSDRPATWRYNILLPTRRVRNWLGGIFFIHSLRDSAHRLLQVFNDVYLLATSFSYCERLFLLQWYQSRWEGKLLGNQSDPLLHFFDLREDWLLVWPLHVFVLAGRTWALAHNTMEA